MAITLVCGDDPYLERREVEKLLGEGEAERFPSFTRETVSALSSASLFGPPKALLVADGIGDLDAPCFWAYLSLPNPDADLVIWTRSVDRRLKAWTKIKEEKAVTVRWVKKASERVAAGFVLSVATRRGCVMEGNLADEAVALSGYESDPEVNFYTLGNEMTALADAMEEGRRTVTEEDVKRFFGREDPVNRFAASRRIADGDESVARDAEKIGAECGGAIPFLMLLARDFRVAYKAKFLPPSEIGAGKTPLCQWSAEDLLKGLTLIADAARSLKEGEMPDGGACASLVWKILKIRKAGNANG